MGTRGSELILGQTVGAARHTGQGSASGHGILLMHVCLRLWCCNPALFPPRLVVVQALQLPLVVRPAQEAQYYEVRWGRGDNRLDTWHLALTNRSALLNLCTSTSAAGSVRQGCTPMLGHGNGHAGIYMRVR